MTRCVKLLEFSCVTVHSYLPKNENLLKLESRLSSVNSDSAVSITPLSHH
jgi:hypothetical protein